MQFLLKKITLVLHQLNQIRDSLAVMGDNSTAFSLPQVRQSLIFMLCNAIRSIDGCESLDLKYASSAHIML